MGDDLSLNSSAGQPDDLVFGTLTGIMCVGHFMIKARSFCSTIHIRNRGYMFPVIVLVEIHVGMIEGQMLNNSNDAMITSLSGIQQLHHIPVLYNSRTGCTRP